MRILAVLHSPPGSGSDTTIRRIGEHLIASGHSVFFAQDGGRPGFLTGLARTHRADILIGTHALLGGQALRETRLPYVLAFGGTDLNEYVHDREFLALMAEVVDEAAALVAFNTDFVVRCLSLWPHTEDKLHLIPQGVRTEPAPSYSMRDSLNLAPDAQVFLLPSGLRPVKDPLLLIDVFQRWHREDPRIHLVIAGLSYDEDFEGIVRRRIAGDPGVRYVGALPRPELQAAMCQSAAVLNTSLSECSPNTVLEAMSLDRPIIARNIPGNTCVVLPDRTGLLFDDPDDFRRQAERLLADPGLAARLGRQAGEYVRVAHGVQAEGFAYDRLFARLAASVPVRDARPVLAVPAGLRSPDA